MHKKKESFQQQVFNEIEKIIGHYNKLTIPMPFLHFCDNLESAVFLAQLIYWCDKGKSPSGYIYKTAKEWYSETGLSEYHVRKSEKKFKDMGILETSRKKANKAPTIHYKLNREAFMDKLLKFLRQEAKKLKKQTSNISDSITEPTAFPTTEPTKKTHKGLHKQSLAALSFNEYKTTHQVEEETSEAIEYFMEQYEIHRGKPHPRLKQHQWESVSESLRILSSFADEPILKFEYLKDMVDKYFITKFIEGCNYSILHFNTDKVKENRFYETSYYGDGDEGQK